MDRKTVIIIGGGVAGISAAVHAIRKGWQPLLIEATPTPGGRVRSLFAKDVQSYIDNGQHVLSASYAETIGLLDILGSRQKVHFQERLFIHFQIDGRHRMAFRSWPLPPPLHFLLPLLLRAPLAYPDRQFLKRFGWQFWRTRAADLRNLTVREWLDEVGESPLLEKLLWQPLTLATLNTPLEAASAELLYTVLQQGFLGTSRNCGLGLPTDMLATLFAQPGERFIRENGGDLRCNTIAKRLIIEGNRVVALETHRGEQIDTPALILAIPPHSLARLLDASPGLDQWLPVSCRDFEYSPIITINIWCREPIPTLFPVALVDSPIQWIFSLPPPAQAAALHGYALVISAAFAEVNQSAAALLQLAERELRHYFRRDLPRGFQLVRSKIVKEKTATFLQTPAAQRLRPAPQTRLSNLFLAGDWIDTGLPATIESAARSGRLAAELL